MFSMSGQHNQTGSTLDGRSTPLARTSLPRDISTRTLNLTRRISRKTTRRPAPPSQPERPMIPVTLVRREKPGSKQPEPSSPTESRSAIYVTVYEAKDFPREGFTRQFLRECTLDIQPDYRRNAFLVYKVVGEPLQPLTYKLVRGTDPRESPRNLTFDFVTWIPRDRIRDVAAIFGQITPRVFKQAKDQASESWNSQMFIQEGLKRMAMVGILTRQEMLSAMEKQRRGVNVRWSGDEPNLYALAREHSDRFIP